MNPLGLFLEPSGPLLTHLHTVYMACSERLPTRLNPLAERTCFSQVEVIANGERMGFLSEGAFFGEAPVLDPFAGSEVRTRTVISVTSSTELCYITKDTMVALQKRYPEMDARMKRFMRTGMPRGRK